MSQILDAQRGVPSGSLAGVICCPMNSFEALGVGRFSETRSNGTRKWLYCVEAPVFEPTVGLG